MTDRKIDGWPLKALAGEYRATGACHADPYQPWAVKGLLPRTGASMWFGAGGVGKTQLLLWLAAHLACADGDGPDHWLDGKIQRRGQILVLSAEDLREQLFGRLAGILQAMMAEHAGLDADAIAERIHCLPFLSLDEDEFDDASPRLFRMAGGEWRPTRTLENVERFITGWNTGADAGDRIIGVVLDSAVSMAGFELQNTEATTNFLYHLNRRARQQDVFWAIIGHQPKAVSIDSADPAANAVARLRGSAMWSTTPRTVVEVRTATDDEADAVRGIRPSLPRRDMLVVTLVKANSQDADFAPRTLERLQGGAFQDLSAQLGDAPPRQSTGANDVAAAVVEVIAGLTDGGTAGATFSREDLKDAVEQAREQDSRLAKLDLETRGRQAKPNNLAGVLQRLHRDQLIENLRNAPARVRDLSIALQGG